MNNIKRHKWLFLGVLLGIAAFGYLTVKSLNFALNAEYVQIKDLFLGFFFGLITLSILVFLLFFFRKEDIDTVSCNTGIFRNKWTLLEYFSVFLAVLCFIVSGNFYRNRNEQYDFVEITITQTNDSKIRGRREGKKDIIIVSKEYPDYFFQINRVPFKYMDSDSYIKNVKPGDTLTAMITRDSYDKKIAKTKSLSFKDKTVDYKLIGICGLQHRNIELLATKDFIKARKQYAEFSVFFYMAIGIILLYYILK